MIFIIISLSVLTLILDDFWHRFCLHFGTTLTQNSMPFEIICLMILDNYIFVDLYQLGMLPFWIFFRILTAPVPQGAFWDVPWLDLASFWLPFGSPFGFLFAFLVPLRFHVGIGKLPFRHPNL